MTSRERILERLRSARQPFDQVLPLETIRAMAPVEDTRPQALLALFVEQAQMLDCTVRVCTAANEAQDYLLSIIGEDYAISCWDPAYVPLPGLDDTLRKNGIRIAHHDDASVRVGVTGADAALVATGSLVLTAGPGKSRLVSLLPNVHVAIITLAQIVPNLEAWATAHRASGLDRFRQANHWLVISGPSRTADIAMELVLGVHGPAEMHVIVLAQ